MSDRPLTKMSRRLLELGDHPVESSRGPASASMHARWQKVEVQELMLSSAG